MHASSAAPTPPQEYNLHRFFGKNMNHVLGRLKEANPPAGGLNSEQLSALAGDEMKRMFRHAAQEHYDFYTRNAWRLAFAGQTASAWFGITHNFTYLLGIVAFPVAGLVADRALAFTRWNLMRQQTDDWWSGDGTPNPEASGHQKIFEAAQREVTAFDTSRAAEVILERMAKNRPTPRNSASSWGWLTPAPQPA